MTKCNRCKQPVEKPECCWFCDEDLCVGCWDYLGHCGHFEAELINEIGRLPDRPFRDVSIHTVIAAARAGGRDAVYALVERPS